MTFQNMPIDYSIHTPHSQVEYLEEKQLCVCTERVPSFPKLHNVTTCTAFITQDYKQPRGDLEFLK